MTQLVRRESGRLNNDVDTIIVMPPPSDGHCGGSIAALMVDSPRTRDRDDAFSVDRTASGWEVSAYISAVANLVAMGSDADRDAMRAGFTRYRPAGTMPMLGRDIESAGTLSAASDREAMLVNMTFATDGELIDYRIGRTVLPAGTCVALTHQQVSTALTDSADVHHQHLVGAHELASTLMARRRAAGAFALFDSARGLVTSEDGQLVRLAAGQTADAHLIVQELMVAANTTVAQWAIERDIPILFRNHRRAAVAPDTNDLLAEVAAELNSAPIVTESIVKSLTARVNQTLRAAVYEPIAHSHYGLRVAAYCHATSPLRRYPDLVTQRIIFAELDNAQQPYTLEQLADIGAAVNDLVRERKAARSSDLAAETRRSAAQTIVSGSFAALSRREWLRVLRIAAQSDPPPPVVKEVLSRAAAGALDGAQIAALLSAESPRWRPLAARVIDATRESAPHHAASVLSAWQQADGGDTTAPSVEVECAGPAHEPTFAVRLTLESARSSWVVGESKKQAEQGALWELIEIVAGIKTSVPPRTAPVHLANTAQPSTRTEPPTGQVIALTGRPWLKAIRAAVASPPPDSLSAEIRSRAQAGTLEGPVVAAMLTASANGWRELRLHAIAELRSVVPNLALPIFTAWQQTTGRPPQAPPTDVRRTGAPHEAVFAIRATYGRWLSRWHSAPSKRDAEQQAIWDLIECAAGGVQGQHADRSGSKGPAAAVSQGSPLSAGQTQGDGQTVDPCTPNGRKRWKPAAFDSVAAVVAAAPDLPHPDVPDVVLEHSPLASLIGDSPDTRAKKYRNAVKAPAAWVNNLARQCGSEPVVAVDVAEDGVEVSVAVTTPAGRLAGRAVAANKKAARAAASLELIVEAFMLGDPAPQS